jgi:hypothetical protein
MAKERNLEDALQSMSQLIEMQQEAIRTADKLIKLKDKRLDVADQLMAIYKKKNRFFKICFFSLVAINIITSLLLIIRLL